MRDVLGRPRIRRKFPHLTGGRVEEFLASAQAKGVILDEVPRAFRLARDPDDEPYLNLAIAADARYLVSRDHDLLDLMADPAFRGQYPGITILDPAALLRAMRAPDPGDEPDTLSG